MSSAARIARLEQENADLGAELASVKQQLDWFKRQLFGEKSERRLDIDPALQRSLFERFDVAVPPEKSAETETITYQRRKKQRDHAVNDSGLRFDDSVPREVIVVTDPVIDSLAESERDKIGEKVTYRLAQRPGSHVVLEYRLPVYKRRDNGKIITAQAPVNVLERTATDVSLLAGLLIDKFAWHLPLYRQHQRLQQAGIQVSRASLTTWSNRAIDLLAPIVEAQYRHILQSRVLAMDETPIKAGRQQRGKLRQAYLWPLYGDADEIVFRYAPTRAHHHVQDWLKDFAGTLLSDGYEAYAAYARNNPGVTHAQCWSHCRRHFEQAQESDAAASEALTLIGGLYRHEQIIRDQALAGADKLAYRSRHSEPIAQAFWAWCDEQCHRLDLRPQDPLSKALTYAGSRKASLQVFLGDPEVAIDTNHLERSLRPVPMGKKSWLFCWTEIGAERVGIIQSLLVTCRLHGVDPYVYLVDVLQRVGMHPASGVIELTPREWKTRFAADPLKSDLSRFDR